MAITPLRNFRVDDDTWENWKVAASLQGVSMSEFIRLATDAYATQDPFVARQEIYRGIVNGMAVSLCVQPSLSAQGVPPSPTTTPKRKRGSFTSYGIPEPVIAKSASFSSGPATGAPRERVYDYND